MLMHLPIVLLASLPLTRVADEVPKFDIAAECRSEGGTDSQQQHCAEDEAESRDELRSGWGQFAAPDKASCTRQSSMDGTGSYTELLTCLEMARDATPKPAR
jgi:hypothetical protein